MEQNQPPLRPKTLEERDQEMRERLRQFQEEKQRKQAVVKEALAIAAATRRSAAASRQPSALASPARRSDVALRPPPVLTPSRHSDIHTFSATNHPTTGRTHRQSISAVSARHESPTILKSRARQSLVSSAAASATPSSSLVTANPKPTIPTVHPSRPVNNPFYQPLTASADSAASLTNSRPDGDEIWRQQADLLQLIATNQLLAKTIEQTELDYKTRLADKFDELYRLQREEFDAEREQQQFRSKQLLDEALTVCYDPIMKVGECFRQIEPHLTRLADLNDAANRSIVLDGNFAFDPVRLERDAASIKQNLQALQPYLHHIHLVTDHTKQLVDTVQEEDAAIAESERLADILQNLLIISNAQS